MKTRKYKYYKCEEDGFITFYRKSGGILEYLDENCNQWAVSLWGIKALKKRKSGKIFEISKEEWVLIDKT